MEIDLDAVVARLGIKLEEELAHWFSEAELERAAGTYRRHYVELASATAALPGAEQALAAVSESGARALIVTAKHARSVTPCLGAAGLQADGVVCFVHGEEKAAVLRAAGAWLYVGDTPADMSAARSAGALAVGVTTGSFDSSALEASGAGVVLETLGEFPAFYRARLAARRSG